MGKSTIDRFTEKFTEAVGGGCAEWTASTDGGFGYGKFRLDGAMQQAHRVSWKLFVGPIPKGLNVLHKCDNPPCVNPRHLFLGTNADNVRDRDEKGRNGSSVKTHCPRGHKYDQINTYIRPNGHRNRGCRPCRRELSRKWNQARAMKGINP